MDDEAVVATGAVVPETPVVTPKKKSGFVSKSLYHLYAPLDYEGNPLVVDGVVVEMLKIHKKRPMELMGVDIVEIGRGNIDVLTEMLQRSCTPALSAEDVNNLDLPVILESLGVFRSFFAGTQSVMSVS